MVLFVLLSFSFVVSVEADSSLWIPTYCGTGYDQAQALAETSDGGYAMTGSTTSFGAGNAVGWVKFLPFKQRGYRTQKSKATTFKDGLYINTKIINFKLGLWETSPLGVGSNLSRPTFTFSHKS
jgi:hypothetical protein